MTKVHLLLSGSGHTRGHCQEGMHDEPDTASAAQSAMRALNIITFSLRCIFGNRA